MVYRNSPKAWFLYWANKILSPLSPPLNLSENKKCSHKPCLCSNNQVNTTHINLCHHKPHIQTLHTHRRLILSLKSYSVIWSSTKDVALTFNAMVWIELHSMEKKIWNIFPQNPFFVWPKKERNKHVACHGGEQKIFIF